MRVTLAAFPLGPRSAISRRATWFDDQVTYEDRRDRHCGRMGKELVRAAHAAGCTIVGAVEREGSPAIDADVGVIAGLAPLGVAVTPMPSRSSPAARASSISPRPRRPSSSPPWRPTPARTHDRHHRLDGQRRSAHRRGGSPRADRQGREHEPGRQPAGGSDAHASPRRWTRTSTSRSSRCIIATRSTRPRHRADARRRRRQGRAIDLRQRSSRCATAYRPTPARRHRLCDADGGSVVGEHKVIFAGAGERIELAHVAGDRSVFARGAVKALLRDRQAPALLDDRRAGALTGNPSVVPDDQRNHTLVLVPARSSEWNRRDLFTGWCNPDLTEKGLIEALVAAHAALGTGVRLRRRLLRAS